MLEYNEILPKKMILLDGEPYEVLDAHVFRKQQRKPVNQTKLRNIISGKVTERSFHVSEKADEADLSTREIKFLYENRGEYWFCNPSDPKERFSLPRDTVGFPGQFMKANSVVEALLFDGKIISVRVPIKVTLKVTDAPPAVKGNTAQGGTKQIILETGASVNTPLFINEGDSVIVNTQTGEYVERG
ncbi:MAG: elongation factor P [Minisyncoccia bacterium]